MKIYTKQGDDGNTGIWGGNRIAKDDCRIDAYGTLDELSATLGMAASCGDHSGEFVDLIRSIQHQLFGIGSELATDDPQSLPFPPIDKQAIRQLELEIDRVDAKLPPLKNFILPGGVTGASTLHLARTVCRRAERRVVSLSKLTNINSVIIPYLNRLSDLLFVMARATNASHQVSDIAWQRPS